ncbi:hypothetical protein N783_07980 [Pontibacillus marinus BH030004 = DSM 16465]|uniref:Holin-like toxin n=1 Tax=Pontibacillus marinus BH030004 = DSM 16465 TaxID=1385511 RepID=A0A0A5I6T6_9BACI|nr:hypothetical protein N783_07980 [Pontibacillus marinus BH030004 = DSM 16465]
MDLYELFMVLLTSGLFFLGFLSLIVKIISEIMENKK